MYNNCRKTTWLSPQVYIFKLIQGFIINVCLQCQGPCESGVQSRTVWCARGGVEGAAGAARDVDCPGVRPAAKKSCVPARCSTRPVAKPQVLTPPMPSGMKLLG